MDHIKLPRYLLQRLPSVAKVEIHGFLDASEKAYGSSIYICAEDDDGNRVSNLVMAKSRVAALRRITLPRLELLAAYITVTLLCYVFQGLPLLVENASAWSDSQIAPAWIRRPSSTWKVFVANRVQEIQKRIETNRWRFFSRKSESC